MKWSLIKDEMSFWRFHKFLTLQLFLQVRFEAWTDQHINHLALELQTVRKAAAGHCHGSELVSSISTVLKRLQPQLASPCTGSTIPPAPATAKAWSCSRTEAAPSVCPALPASSRTDRDHMPPRLVPEHMHKFMEELYELAADMESSMQISCCSCTMTCSPISCHVWPAQARSPAAPWPGVRTWSLCKPLAGHSCSACSCSWRSILPVVLPESKPFSVVSYWHIGGFISYGELWTEIFVA